MKTKYTRLNVGVTTTFDVSQVGGALDGNHFSESVTSHSKKLLTLIISVRGGGTGGLPQSEKQ